jgi:hypothetical protein
MLIEELRVAAQENGDVFGFHRCCSFMPLS